MYITCHENGTEFLKLLIHKNLLFPKNAQSQSLLLCVENNITCHQICTKHLKFTIIF